MRVLTKSDLFNRVIVKKVELSNGDAVHIIPLPAAEVVGGGADKEFKIERLIHRSLCDEKGCPFFAGEDPSQVLSLPISDFTILSKAILELNGMNYTEGGSGQAEKN